MKATLRLFVVAAVAAVVTVASASAATSVAPPSLGVKAAGSVRLLDTRGQLTGFRVYYGVTRTPKIIYTNEIGKVIFHSLTVKVAASSKTAVRFTGLGIADGKRVPFTAIVVAGAMNGGQDHFGISWNHGAQFGGHLMSGNVRISKPLLAGGGGAPSAS